MLWGGLAMSKEALGSVASKTSEIMEQTGATQVLESTVKPNLQYVSESVSSTTTQIYNEGLSAPVL